MIVDSGKDDDSKDKITPIDHTITFMVSNEPYQIISVKNGLEITAPQEPKVSGSLFSGWADKTGAIVSFPMTPTADIELNATFSSLLLSIYDKYTSIDRNTYKYVFVSVNETGTYGTIYFTKGMNADGTKILSCFYYTSTGDVTDGKVSINNLEDINEAVTKTMGTWGATQLRTSCGTSIGQYSLNETYYYYTNYDGFIDSKFKIYHLK